MNLVIYLFCGILPDPSCVAQQYDLHLSELIEFSLIFTHLLTDWLMTWLKTQKSVPRIVFTNNCGTASYLNATAASNDVPTVLLHGDVDIQVKAAYAIYI